jgi:membrane protease YdiL (CAAX protease family)
VDSPSNPPEPPADGVVVAAPVSTRRVVLLTLEYVGIFFVVAGAFALAKVPGGPIPVLIVLAVAAVFYLRRQPDFDRRDFWRSAPLRGELPSMAAMWALATVVGVVAIWFYSRSMLFDLPRQQTLLWLAVIVGYPVFSVYPQELVFRAFLLHRYAPLFRTPRRLAAASAAAFGFAHILFGNVLAVVLTLVGGWLFARRYQRTRSLLTVCVEHAGYGLIIFTIGLGRYFYHAAVH